MPGNNTNLFDDENVQQNLTDPAELQAPADENQPGQDPLAPPLMGETGNPIVPGESEIKQDDPKDNDPSVTDPVNPPDDENVQQKSVELIKMVRDEGNPSTADVHPLEVENFKTAGWRIEE